MAGNIAGMFQQINNAIGTHSMANGNATGLLDRASRGAGQVLGGMTGADPTDFMNAGAKGMEQESKLEKGNKALSELDLTTVEGMRQAAAIYSQMGNPEKAMEMANAAQQKQQQQMATLDAGQEEIRKGSARTSAAGLAMSRGDKDAHKAIVGGFLEPEEYIAHVLDEKPDPEPEEIGRAHV